MLTKLSGALQAKASASVAEGKQMLSVTANSDQRCAKLDNGQQHCAKVIQTNNVEVDDRGYIYIVDRANNGMHILELTGPAREAANFPK